MVWWGTGRKTSGAVHRLAGSACHLPVLCRRHVPSACIGLCWCVLVANHLLLLICLLQETLGAPAAARAIYEELVDSLKPAGEQKAAAAATAPAAASPAAVNPEGGSASQEAPAQQAAEGAADGQQQADEAAAAADGAAAVKTEAGEQAPPPPPAAAPAAEGQQEAASTQQPQEQAQQAQQGSIQLSAEQGTLAWVQYMRFARRAEGIMAARKVNCS